MTQFDFYKSPNKPWNAGRIIGPKAPFKPKHVWAIRLRFGWRTDIGPAQATQRPFPCPCAHNADRVKRRLGGRASAHDRHLHFLCAFNSGPGPGDR